MCSGARTSWGPGTRCWMARWVTSGRGQAPAVRGRSTRSLRRTVRPGHRSARSSGADARLRARASGVARSVVMGEPRPNRSSGFGLFGSPRGGEGVVGRRDQVATDHSRRTGAAGGEESSRNAGTRLATIAPLPARQRGSDE
ncbi:bkrf1 encodes ebna-1 protein-like protein [Thermomicrobium roseum DSM 5159]|uniref:Bkrf1 encodes ebna-1 protein-like protein n=1 Tax=Thermomicrobium roseum (strain ATCC 27502 / DSM 5159 / P-2) TaxID=309801 RepID=B9KXV1_THERP|nr:bkrf1 encodes ebna-1 protein-like protein [Thermomicrobium roseum DSM 5159]